LPSVPDGTNNARLEPEQLGDLLLDALISGSSP
jgi:hypothetical protein